MTYSICYIKNTSGEVKILRNKEFAIDEHFKIEDSERAEWATSDEVLLAVAKGEFTIQNCCGDIDGISNQIDWLKEY